jgi:beta-galactosidase
MGDADFVDTVTAYIVSQCGVKPILETPQSVEVTLRWHENESFMFILNHSNEIQTIELDRAYEDLISGAPHTGSVTLQPKQVMILR